MNYSEMSDFEINFQVALAKGYDTDVKQHFGDAGLAVVKTTEGSFNYCNSWADAGPIIAENKITILTDETTEEWSAAVVQDFCDERAFKYSNCAGSPIRAAMITFLMMREEKCSN